MSLFDYLEERYAFNDNALAEKLYREYLNKEGFTIAERPYGFVIYKFEGDACIINDVFVCKEFRGTKRSWDLFKLVKHEVDQRPSCRVMIGFSEYGGQHREQGIRAMLAVGFEQMQELKDRTVFIRGTN